MQYNIAHTVLKSISPYSPSRFFADEVPKEKNEKADVYEQRTWRHKGHYDKEQRMVIPAMAFKSGIAAAAQYLGMRVEGKGKATYSKHFKSAVLVANDALITPAVTFDKVAGVSVLCAADGKKGGSGGTSVVRRFPIVYEWEVEVDFYVYDNVITEDVFLTHLEAFGTFIGIGRFRPQNGGLNGRFKVKSFRWEKGKGK